jgi:hypothetical protein
MLPVAAARSDGLPTSQGFAEWWHSGDHSQEVIAVVVRETPIGPQGFE